MADFANFNGLPKNCVHPAMTKEGQPVLGSDGKQLYNVSIMVPQEVSRDGYVQVATTNCKPTKNDPEKFNVGFPEDWKLKVKLCTFKKEGEKSKYKDDEIVAKKLLSHHIAALKAMKERDSQNVEAEVEEEAEGPEL